MRQSLMAGLLVASLLVPAAAFGQTGLGLSISTWHDPDEFDIAHSAMFVDDGDSENPGTNFSLQRFDTQARYRLTPPEDRDIRLGFEHHYLDIDTNHPALPTRLVDVSAGVAFDVGQWEEWDIEAVVGGGYAGNNPFGDGRSYYADLAVIMRRPISENWSQQFSINFNQNRSVFPDIPLPSTAYIYTGRPDMVLQLGLPVSAVNWQIAPGLTLDAQYIFVLNGRAKLTYRLSDEIALFGAFRTATEAFRLDDAPEHRRLFFRQRTVELGATYSPMEDFQLELAGGFAFDQEFTEGWDLRSADDTIKVSDEPYIRVGLTYEF